MWPFSGACGLAAASPRREVSPRAAPVRRAGGPGQTLTGESRPQKPRFHDPMIPRTRARPSAEPSERATDFAAVSTTLSLRERRGSVVDF